MDQAIVRRYLDHVDERISSFGRVRSVYHDKTERVPHVDIYIIDAELAGASRIVLLTVGCAFVDRGTQDLVELAMVLPDSWPISEADLARPEAFWPFAWLRLLGREMPRLPYGPLPCDLWRIPRDPARPAATRFSAILGAPGEWIHGELERGLVRPDGESVRVTTLIPVDDGEREWAIERGDDAEDGTVLAELLEPRASDAIVVDEQRASFIPA